MGEREKEEMKRTNSVKLMLAALVAMLAMASVCWSAEPPPPVDQNLGIPDSVFNLLDEEDCEYCHNQNPPIAAVDPTYLPDRHHLLIGTAVPSPTAAPNPTVGGGTYECLTCHTMVWNSATSSYSFAPYRDCLLCHSQSGGYTVHHSGATAQGGDCVACHGGLVENMGDHTNPTYDTSLVTPWPSDKPNADTNGEGNCNFCHNVVALPGTSATPVLDAASGVMVYTNQDTHHSTGFGGDSSKCAWCHSQGSGTPAIRTCEGCHGIKSLHSIQLGLGAATSPGNEGPYKGHIGDQWDCWGCHGNNGISAASVTGAPFNVAVPVLKTVSASSFVEGAKFKVIVYGFSFIDSTPDGLLESTFQLVNESGETIPLEILNLTNDTAELVISTDPTDPDSLAVGKYTLTARKALSGSNPLVLVVKNGFTISSAIHTGTIYNLKGDGLVAAADYEAAELGTRVFVTDVDGNTGECPLVSWTPSDVIVNCDREGSTITVKTLFSQQAARSEVKRVAPTRILPARR